MLPYIIAGLLGALVAISLTGATIVLPQVHQNKIHLGFIGRVVIGVTASIVYDHNFNAALVAALVAVLAPTVFLEYLIYGITPRIFTQTVYELELEQRLKVLERERESLRNKAREFKTEELPDYLKSTAQDIRQEIENVRTELEDTRFRGGRSK